MKRLIKKNNYYDDIRNKLIDKSDCDTNMIPLNELDSVEVKFDKCPNCINGNLIKQDGFKICDKCMKIYKIFNGECYLIDEPGV